MTLPFSVPGDPNFVECPFFPDVGRCAADEFIENSSALVTLRPM
jgi:hypothetical protein